ncbi:MAG: transposase [Synechococcaceae cyanobacterium]
MNPLILFKILILQQLFNFSDEELEFQVNDRRSFEEFFELGVMNNILDVTAFAFFRERLRNGEIIEELFKLFEISNQGLRRACLWRHNHVNGWKDDEKDWTWEDGGVVGSQETCFQLSLVSSAHIQAVSSCVNIKYNIANRLPLK